MSISSEQLAKLKEQAKLATPGPWKWKSYRNGYAVYSERGNQIARVPQGPSHTDPEYLIDGGWNTDFIAAANPQTVLDLIAEIERLRAIAGESY